MNSISDESVNESLLLLSSVMKDQIIDIPYETLITITRLASTENKYAILLLKRYLKHNPNIIPTIIDSGLLESMKLTQNSIGLFIELANRSDIVCQALIENGIDEHLLSSFSLHSTIKLATALSNDGFSQPEALLEYIQNNIEQLSHDDYYLSSKLFLAAAQFGFRFEATLFLTRGFEDWNLIDVVLSLWEYSSDFELPVDAIFRIWEQNSINLKIRLLNILSNCDPSLVLEVISILKNIEGEPQFLLKEAISRLLTHIFLEVCNQKFIELYEDNFFQLFHYTSFSLTDQNEIENAKRVYLRLLTQLCPPNLQNIKNELRSDEDFTEWISEETPINTLLSKSLENT